MNTTDCLINRCREETARSWFASSSRARATNAAASTKILRGAFMVCFLAHHKDSGQYSRRDRDRRRRPIASPQSQGAQLSRTDQCSFVLPVLLSKYPVLFLPEICSLARLPVPNLYRYPHLNTFVFLSSCM